MATGALGETDSVTAKTMREIGAPDRSRPEPRTRPWLVHQGRGMSESHNASPLSSGLVGPAAGKTATPWSRRREGSCVCAGGGIADCLIEEHTEREVAR